MKSAGSADAAGFVLAGGRSSRMGTDKASLLMAGESLLARALRLLRFAGVQASIAGARCDAGGLTPLIEDREPGQGPLGGVCAALASTTLPWALFLPVDLPLLPLSLLEYLLRRARVSESAVTLPSANGLPQTFPVVLRRDLLSSLQDELGGGRRGCFAAFRAAASQAGEEVSVVAVELLAQAGQAAHPAGLPPYEWFLNVNTPEEFRRAESLETNSLA